jgi:ABC-type transport system involved in multi-copper enzyme maturation permease subunit
MSWVVWRQHRAEALWSLALLALLMALLVLGGRDMFAAYQQAHDGTTTAACALGLSQDPICSALTGDFQRRYGDSSVLLLLLTVLPALAGMFLGAPLVAREIERGTHQLAWTQGVSRLRWIGAKVGALALLTVVVFIPFSLLLMWWRGPLDQVTGTRFSLGFDVEGVAPVAYALFALALGVAASAVFRRTLAAMAVTALGFIGLRLVVELVFRPHFLPPLARISSPLGGATAGSPDVVNSDWLIPNGFYYLDRAGHSVNELDAISLCHGYLVKGVVGDFSSCLQDHGLRLVNLFQPADRFWLFQGIESAIFLTLAVALLGLAIWWVTARIS